MSDGTTTPVQRRVGKDLVRGTAMVLALLVNIAAIWLVIHRSDSGPEKADPVKPEPVLANTAAQAAETSEISLVVTPRASGTVSVVERVRAGDRLRLLTLRPPPSGPDDNLRPQILGLRIEVRGKPLRKQPPTALTGSWLAALPSPARDIVLRYDLAGVTRRSRPAPDPRALLTLRPLTSTDLGDSTTVVEIAGVVVHNLVCPDLPVADQLCGRQEGDRWRTAGVPTDQSTVVAQIDLPPPAGGGA
jgi:hypothetical protein